MSIPRVTMRNATTKAEIQAPETAVKIYEASGWTVVQDKDAKAEPTPAPDPASAGKSRTTAKEETK
jgi:hypothetical protein